MKKSIEDDIFIPLYPKSSEEGKMSPHSKFQERQFWGALKLFRNILLWNGLLPDDTLQDLGLGKLLNRYLIISLTNAVPGPDVVKKCSQIAACLPERWFENSAMRTSIPQLENFIKFLLQSAQKLSSSEFRNEVSEIILILVKVKALTQAESLREERPLEPLPAQSTGVWVRRVGVPRVKMTVSQPMPPLLGAHLGCGQASWCFVAEGSNAQQQPSSVCCSFTLSIRKEMKQSDTQKHAWIKTIFSKLQCLQIS